MIKKIFLCSFFFAHVFLLKAQQNQDSSFVRLNTEIEQLKNDSTISHGSWSVCVMDVKTGKILADYNDDKSLIPASTMKIMTTGAALSELGTNFRFKTKIEYDGFIKAGVLNGNIYIKGGGDPSLGSEYFKKKNDTTDLMDYFAEIIHKKGIKKITGTIIADASIFDFNTTSDEWVWGDMGNYYGSGACGLSYKDNIYTIYFDSGNIQNDSTRIDTVEPFVPNLKFINYLRTRGYRDNSMIYSSPYSDVAYVSGTIPAHKHKFPVKGSIPDAPYFCSYSLYESLLKKNISVAEAPINSFDLFQKEQNENASEKGKDKKNERHLLYVYQSPTLDNIVYFTNMFSINLFAEHLLKTLGVEKYHYGSERSGINAVENFWKSQGMDLNGLYMADGCGLAREDVITTYQETFALRTIANDSLIFSAFYRSLPVAGKTGSLHNMLKHTFAEGNMHAKSGYVSRDRSYAGYVNDKNGNLICFSIIANNYECSASEMKKKMERIMLRIAELE
ncbi:MAG TPA: D-alanyl-D-alanine carboxypeptidase/D-alanyl-D-alanine-endopeptidase [Bacteroidia bacterium]|nr:D-alanyl-D-alanine carboxypeptidase/D-alanyl-D-alanine-endopeptidase [Bacteroidia bacterium]